MLASQAQVIIDQNGIIRVSGDLNFSSVMPVYNKAQELFRLHEKIKIDLEAVSRSDSAGLALLVEWYRDVKAMNKSFSLQNMPEQ